MREKDTPRVARDEVIEVFRSRFGSAPEFLVRTPGGVNLVGDHGDYNDGFILPMTIDRAVWMGVRGRSDGTVRVYSVAYDKELAFDAHEKLEKGQDAWFEYIRGCARALRQGHEGREKETFLNEKNEKKPLNGFDAVLLGDVPWGIGLASSAALTVGALLAFDESGRLGLSKMEIAKLAQRAKIQWVGAQRGIAAPMICSLGEAKKALLIDCLSLEHHSFDMFAGMAVAVLDAGIHRSSVESEHDERRRQCEDACRIFGVPSLQEATLEMLDIHQKEMPEVLFRRVCHVLTENMRTCAAATAMEYSENNLFGTLMNESHFSLRYEFDASFPESDAICSIARAHPACLGARTTGGFADSSVALVYAAAAREFADYVCESYRKETGKDARVYICASSDGARVERL
jgi:galactokinase